MQPLAGWRQEPPNGAAPFPLRSLYHLHTHQLQLCLHSQQPAPASHVKAHPQACTQTAGSDGEFLSWGGKGGGVGLNNQ